MSMYVAKDGGVCAYELESEALHYGELFPGSYIIIAEHHLWEVKQ